MHPRQVGMLCPVVAVLFLMQFSVPPPAAAQHGAVLSGTVVDASSGDPLHGVNVLLEGTTHGAATDEEGRFELEEIESGTYTVRLSHVGYATYREEVTLEDGERHRLDVELEPQDVAVQELVVTEDQVGDRQDAGVSRVPVQFVRDLPTVLEPDVFRSLQLLPGIQAASDYSSGLYIRGGSPDQTLIRLDDATLYNPTHAFGFFSTFNPDAVEDVDVYKGSFPAMYGGRLGSVVAIGTRRGRTDRTGGGLSVGLLASRAFIEGPIGDSSYLLSVRRSTLEPVLSVLNQTDIEGIPERFHFYDINARTDLKLSERDRLTLSLYAGSDALVLPFLEEEAFFDVTYGNQMISATWNHVFSGRLLGRISASGSRYFSDPVAYITGTSVEQHNSVDDFVARGTLAWHVNEHHELEAGFEIGHMRFGVYNQYDDDPFVDFTSESGYAGAYLQDTFRAGERWRVDVGVRVNYFEQGDYLQLAPRLMLEHRLSSTVRVRTSYGRYYQFLGLETNETMSAFDQWYPSAEGVPPSFGDQLATGLTLELDDRTVLEIEGFARTMKNLFRVNPFLPDRNEISYEETFLRGEGFAYGAEFMLRREVGWLNGFIGYTLGRARRSYDEINEGRWYAPTYDRTHDLTVVANVDATSQWRITGVFRYATGQAYSPALGQYRMVDEPLVRRQGPGRVAVIDSRFNAARMPPYHRLDIGVTRRGQLFGSVDYELQAQAINVYQQRNIWFYFFDVDTGGVPEQKDIPQIPVIVPNLSLSLYF